MSVNPMLGAGVNSIQQALKAVDSVAQEIAGLNTANDADNPSGAEPKVEKVAEAIVDLKVYQRQVQASAQVVQTADEILGFLLDVRA